MKPSLFVAYINLDRVPQRRAFMEAQLAAAGIAATRISAVDRAAPGFTPRGGLGRVREDVFIEMNHDGRPYVAGEEACLQSHVLALTRFLDSGAPFGLILEDDAELAPGFRGLLDEIVAQADLWDLVKLEGNRRRGRRPALVVAPLTPPYRLVASMNQAAGAAALLFSRRAAETVRDRIAAAFEPYDNFIAAPGNHGLRMLDCAPFPARQAIAESSRADTRSKPRRTLWQALVRWRRHLAADLFRRNLGRWPAHLRAYGRRAKGLVMAPWARDWDGPGGTEES